MAENNAEDDSSISYRAKETAEEFNDDQRGETNVTDI
jgi:hypothetical protein